MNNTLTSFVAVLVLAIVTVFPGCSWLENTAESVCTKALPVLVLADGYADEAQVKLDRARDIIVDLPDPAARDKGLVACDVLQRALTAARAEITAAQKACKSLDIATTFGAFIDSWPDLKPFLALLGGPGGSKVEDPLVLGEARR